MAMNPHVALSQIPSKQRHSYSVVHRYLSTTEHLAFGLGSRKPSNGDVLVAGESLYRFVSNSTAPADGKTVVDTGEGVGRWFVVNRHKGIALYGVVVVLRVHRSISRTTAGERRRTLERLSQ
jgi:hypothetical protein